MFSFFERFEEVVEYCFFYSLWKATKIAFSHLKMKLEDLDVVSSLQFQTRVQLKEARPLPVLLSV